MWSFFFNEGKNRQVNQAEIAVIKLCNQIFGKNKVNLTVALNTDFSVKTYLFEFNLDDSLGGNDEENSHAKKIMGVLEGLCYRRSYIEHGNLFTVSFAEKDAIVFLHAVKSDLEQHYKSVAKPEFLF